MSNLEQLPARITLQIRDGVPNVLQEFLLSVKGTRPAATPENGAKLDHDAALNDIIEALAMSMRTLIERSRDKDPDNPEFEKWLGDLADWTVRA